MQICLYVTIILRERKISFAIALCVFLFHINIKYTLKNAHSMYMHMKTNIIKLSICIFIFLNAQPHIGLHDDYDLTV